jgi:hypothetical protein
MKFNRQKHLDETRSIRIDKNGHNKRINHFKYMKDKQERDERLAELYRVYPDLKDPEIITPETPKYMLVRDIGVKHYKWDRRLVSDAEGNLSEPWDSSLIYCQDDDIKNGDELLVSTYVFNLWKDKGGLLGEYKGLLAEYKQDLREKKQKELGHTISAVVSILFILLFIAGHIFLAIVTGG